MVNPNPVARSVEKINIRTVPNNSFFLNKELKMSAPEN